MRRVFFRRRRCRAPSRLHARHVAPQARVCCVVGRWHVHRSVLEKKERKKRRRWSSGRSWKVRKSRISGKENNGNVSAKYRRTAWPSSLHWPWWWDSWLQARTTAVRRTSSIERMGSRPRPKCNSLKTEAQWTVPKDHVHKRYRKDNSMTKQCANNEKRRSSVQIHRQKRQRCMVRTSRSVEIRMCLGSASVRVVLASDVRCPTTRSTICSPRHWSGHQGQGTTFTAAHLLSTLCMVTTKSPDLTRPLSLANSKASSTHCWAAPAGCCLGSFGDVM